jgi:peptidylprolyl isomerase
MGTDKRQRQKEGRQARIAAAEAEQRHSQRRRKYVTFLVMAVAVLLVFAGINYLTGKKSSKVTASGSTTTSGSSAALASAKGKNCVAMKGPLPKGAPSVAVAVGPPPTSLVIKNIKVGTGATVQATDTVTVNYIGVACSTGKIFDSSWSRGQTATFGLDQVIQGWTKGLAGMKVGGERLLGIPSSEGYGSAGSPPDIAPDEALWFVVDMVSATPASATTTAAAGATTTTAATTTTGGATTTTAAAGTTTTAAATTTAP